MLASCDVPFLDKLFPKKEQESSQQEDKHSEGKIEPSGDDIKPSDDTPIDEEEPAAPEVVVYFPKKVIDIAISNKESQYESIVVNFSKDLSLEQKAGHFISSNTAVATIDDYGRLRGVSEGSTVIKFTSTVYDTFCTMTVYVHTSLDNIKREYLRLDNPDDIEVGDELIFACPQFGVAASVNISGGYIIPAPATFSSDGSKITDFSQYVAEYYVGPGKYSDSLTFESQENAYLACKSTTGGRKLSYSDNGKAQINWIVEKPEGYSQSFIVSDDIQNEDYWLMFNKINNNDLRFNIYNSNETELMKIPTIYRKTIIRS